MHRFWNPDEIIARVLAKGVTAKVAPGEKMMLSLVTLAPDAVVPTHSHPHEQMGLMVSGTMEFTIAGETRVFSGNEMYFVPGGVPHSAKGGPGGAVALDAFSPPREEYRQAGR
jgi:quercetin dioxygenase-like cupin family protein